MEKMIKLMFKDAEGTMIVISVPLPSDIEICPNEHIHTEIKHIDLANAPYSTVYLYEKLRMDKWMINVEYNIDGNYYNYIDAKLNK